MYRQPESGRTADPLDGLAFMQSFIDAIPSPLFWLDKEGRYRGCNMAFESFFAIGREALVGKLPEDAFAGSEYSRVYQERNQELLHNPGVQIYATKARLPDGDVRDIVTRKSIIYGPEGGVAGIIGIVTDVTEQRQLEERLRESEARFRTIADYTYHWENWVDENGKLRWLNPAVERITGYTVDECFAMADFPIPLVHPDDLNLVREGFAAAVGGREGQNIRHRMVRKDGRTIWVEVSHQAAYDSGDRFIGHRSSVRDVTAAKENEAALFDARQMLELILDNIPQRVFWKDRNSSYLGGNRAFLGDIGLHFRHEIVGKSDWDLACGTHADLYYRDDQEVMKRDAPKLSIEEPLVLKDGLHWVLTNKVPLHDDGGSVIGLLGAYSDITDRKLAQQKLEETLHHLNAIVDNAQVGIAFLKDGRLIRVNLAFEKMFGYEPGEASQESPAAFFPDKAAFERIVEEGTRALGNGSIYEAETRLCRRNGDAFWVQMRGSAVDSADLGKGSIWILLDIDARKRAVDELHLLNATLAKRVDEETAKSLQKERLLIDQARHAAMGEMIGNIAHQWRQPLSTLGLVVQNLRYDFKEGRLGEADVDEYVAKALKAVGQMSSTIDDFRDFFRPSRQPESFSPVLAIGDCIELVGASLKSNNIELRVTGPKELEIFGYPNEFSQIVLNLISNAKDAMVERKIGHGLIEIDVTKRSCGAVVTVTDNAGGIPSEHMAKIFDPYFTTKDKGTGIGLYMTRTIVDQHMHGTIQACNTADGARFVLDLPEGREA